MKTLGSLLDPRCALGEVLEGFGNEVEKATLQGCASKSVGGRGPSERKPERRLEIRIRIEINNWTRHATTYIPKGTVADMDRNSHK